MWVYFDKKVTSTFKEVKNILVFGDMVVKSAIVKELLTVNQSCKLIFIKYSKQSFDI